MASGEGEGLVVAAQTPLGLLGGWVVTWGIDCCAGSG